MKLITLHRTITTWQNSLFSKYFLPLPSKSLNRYLHRPSAEHKSIISVKMWYVCYSHIQQVLLITWSLPYIWSNAWSWCRVMANACIYNLNGCYIRLFPCYQVNVNNKGNCYIRVYKNSAIAQIHYLVEDLSTELLVFRHTVQQLCPQTPRACI